ELFQNGATRRCKGRHRPYPCEVSRGARGALTLNPAIGRVPGACIGRMLTRTLVLAYRLFMPAGCRRRSRLHKGLGDLGDHATQFHVAKAIIIATCAMNINAKQATCSDGLRITVANRMACGKEGKSSLLNEMSDPDNGIKMTSKEYQA